MIALDAYALVAFLADEPARDEVEGLLREACVVTTVNLAESLDVVGRVYGVDEDELRLRVGPLFGHALSVDSLSEEDAWAVAALRRRHYDRSTRELSLADCFLVAAAMRLQVPLATADPAVASTARDESIEVIALPDSSGRRP